MKQLITFVLFFSLTSPACLSAADQTRRYFLKSLYMLGVGTGLCGIASNFYLESKGGSDVITEFFGSGLKDISSSAVDLSYRSSFVDVKAFDTSCKGQLLLNRKTILTAAHCFSAKGYKQDQKVIVEGIGWARESKDIRFHPQYSKVADSLIRAFEKTEVDPSTYAEIVQTLLRDWKLPDIAIINLDKAAPAFSKPICLNVNDTKETLKFKSLEYIAKEPEVDKLKWSPLKRAPTLMALEGTAFSTIEARTACQSCQGLSGGGLFYLEDGKPFLVSVDSAAVHSFFSVSKDAYCTAPLRKKSRVSLSHLDLYRGWITKTADSFLSENKSELAPAGEMYVPLSFRKVESPESFGNVSLSCRDDFGKLKVDLDKDWNVKIEDISYSSSLKYSLLNGRIFQATNALISIAFPGQAFDLVLLETTQDKIVLRWLGLSEGKTSFENLTCTKYIAR